MDNSAPASGQNDTTATTSRALTHEPPPFLSRITRLSRIYTAKSLAFPSAWLREWKEYFYPPSTRPDIVKSYDIFFPSSYDLTSPSTLPTLFTVHGSAAAPFVLGTPRDDDEFNRTFADKYHVLVIALNYSKAPASVFPAPVHDVEALLVDALGDESLPIDRTSPRGVDDDKKKGRVGILGFGAGGNLAMAVTLLEGVKREECCPGVVVSWGGWLDLAAGGGEEGAWRWGYVPYGVDLRDGLVSPFYARGGEGFRGFIAGEGDGLAGENEGLARRLVGKGEVSRREINSEGGVKKRLEKEDERFWFEEGRVKWVLVPGVGAGFEHREVREEMGWEEEVVKDAEEKTELVMEELGGWLRRVWGVNG
ncbi:uncharacterized protein PODANS_5_3700 [Podospora anserina S mat+]|uniref:Podospora anserina S mat+ genomic DNA chromosome 5, supercontig 4 n=1 Tax=Podospora anserina (strain S / ATCC MYA-4624 / DSM 980 / FGSC 10383) TaxID=515849 RepID=B2ALI3_PODAN|nr:uncharacterized protein PODANS_5_3700 [Podospora anserina S mat+]CAP64821.1 unnamed protein product [Podospora anserina S mat+]CDP29331.1 Putative protein of unknown function [Podospora anserina S mat+]